MYINAVVMENWWRRLWALDYAGADSICRQESRPWVVSLTENSMDSRVVALYSEESYNKICRYTGKLNAVIAGIA